MGLLQLFSQAYGNGNDEEGIVGKLKQIYKLIKFWAIITAIFWVLYCLLYLTQCTKPSTGIGTCFLPFENKSFDTFDYDLSNISTGGTCNSEGAYNNPGQSVDWIDTGYVTNGKQLIVYVNGNYYPWGESQTTKETSYHVVSDKLPDGSISSVLKIIYGPKECSLNTDIPYNQDDTQGTKTIYLNQFNQYTGWNSNNRSKNNSGAVLYKTGQQADCISGINCQFGENSDEQTSCVLKNGAGIYMRIGNDSTFAYHIKNYFVPEYKEECLTSGYCKLFYKTSDNGQSINLVQIPFALPPVIFNPSQSSNKTMFDIREDVLQNLSILTKTDYETEYKFTTVKADPLEPLNSCVGYDRQVVGGLCYKQVVKQLSLEEMKSPNCITSSITNINLANELCPPQENQRIWIKPADTCYDDNTGHIKLTFTSGVVSHSKQISYQHNGLKLSWITSFISALFTPFFGSQTDKVDVDEVIYVKAQENITDSYSNGEKNKKITFCRNDGGMIYYSKLNKDWMVKTEKYGTQGIKISDIHGNDYSDDLKTTFTMTPKYTFNNKNIRDCVEFEFKNIGKVDDLKQTKITRSNTLLVRVTDLDSGLFIKIRNSLMSTSTYHIARIMVVVWFIFSFAIGFLNKQKLLSVVQTISSDWKRFLILLWCSDPNNYDFIDELLWPGLFYGAQSVAVGISDAVSSVYGSSIETDNPLDFFDQVVSSITSKELFYKLGAIATSNLSFIMFFFIFPVLMSAIKDLILAILGPIISLGFTLFGIGNVMMFMPLYALLGLFGTKNMKNTFTKSIKMLISEFVHFAFELGFFGFCIGFCYHYFLESVNMKVCWLEKVHFKLLWIIPIDLDDWKICNSGSSTEASIGERFIILWEMIKNIFKFKLATMIFGKMSITIADMLANIFAKGGGLFGLKNAEKLYGSVEKTGKSLLTKYDKYVGEKEQEEQEAEEMDRKKELKRQKRTRAKDMDANNLMRQLSQYAGRFGAQGNGGGNINNQNTNNNNNNYNVSRPNETNNISNIENRNEDNITNNIDNMKNQSQFNDNDIDIPNIKKSGEEQQKGDGGEDKIIINREVINRNKQNNVNRNGGMISENDMYLQQNNAGIKTNNIEMQENKKLFINDPMQNNDDNQKQKEKEEMQKKVDEDNKVISRKTSQNKGLEKELEKIESQSIPTDEALQKKNEKQTEVIENIVNKNEKIIKDKKKDAYSINKDLKKYD